MPVTILASSLLSCETWVPDVFPRQTLGVFDQGTHSAGGISSAMEGRGVQTHRQAGHRGLRAAGGVRGSDASCHGPEFQAGARSVVLVTGASNNRCT